MTIHANGKPFQLERKLSLPEFLDSIGYATGQVVVERNGEALTPGEVQTTTLSDNDRLEIVQIVAGG